MIRVLSIVFFTISLFANPNIEIFTYPKNPINGTTFLIKVTQDDNKSLKKLSVKFNKKRYKSLKDNTHILLPISYRIKLGRHEIEIYGTKSNNKKFREKFIITIKEGKYPSEKLTVSKKKTSFSKKTLKRIKKERENAIKIYSKFTNKKYKKPFLYPLHTKITSSYGKKRLFNNKLKSYHSGTDFRANMGTPIKVSNDGVVKLAKNRFFAGGSIIIDHGEGIFSVYYHLSKFLVKKGQKVKRGQIIALSGKSGRVTGPHLHFGIVLQNSSVEPLKFVSLMNEFIIKK